MVYSNLRIRSFAFHIFLILYLFVYLTFGFYTELKLVNTKPLPDSLMEDYRYYERALFGALKYSNPYRILKIGPAYLYPPPALLIVEVFSLIKSLFLRASLYWTVNIFLLGLVPYGIAKYYGYKSEQIWYWYVVCLGFAPFLELLHIGQINVITLFGVFLLFIDKERFLGSIGLALAVLTKVSPIMFFIYLILSKKWKTIVLSVIFMLVMLGLSILRYGIFPVVDYPAVLQWLTNQFVFTTNSQSLVAKLANLRDLLSTRFGVQVPILDFLVDHHLLTHRILMIYILVLITVSGLLFVAGKQEREPLFIVIALGMVLSPNIIWYHHYVFFLLPILIWLGWVRLNLKVTIWCLIGLLVIQIDRFLLTYGFLVHIFGHISIFIILSYQLRDFLQKVKLNKIIASA